jgi:serpin B
MRIRTVAPLLAALLLVASCAGSGQANVKIGQERALTVSDVTASAMVDASTDFGLDLLNHLCSAQPNTNQLISPSSIVTALGMAYTGARGETAAQMARVLHLPPAGDPLTAAVAVWRTSLGPLLEGDKAPLAVADIVWTQDGLPLEQTYLDAMRTGYGAGVHVVDFRSDPNGSRKAINSEVERQTRGHIKDLFPRGSIDSSTRLALTDAVYLKARWDGSLTAYKSHMAFTAKGAEAVNVPGVTITLGGYANSGGWQAVELPYEGERLAAVAILPPQSTSPCALDASRLQSLIDGMTQTPGVADLPVLDLSSSYDLADVLSRMGMSDAFGAADFTGITTAEPLQISSVQHKGTLRLDENGTEAAAATGVGMRTSGIAGGAVHVTFDRPYLLLVHDRVSGTPFFLASIANPSAR